MSKTTPRPLAVIAISLILVLALLTSCTPSDPNASDTTSSNSEPSSTPNETSGDTADTDRADGSTTSTTASGTDSTSGDSDSGTTETDTGDEQTDDKEQTDQPENRNPVLVRIDDNSPTERDTVISVDITEAGTTRDPETPTQPTATKGDPLTPKAQQALLERLGDFNVAPTDKTPFSRPTETLRPPRAGETVEQKFPLDTTQSTPGDTTDTDTTDTTSTEAPKLEVLRSQPHGEIDIAPFISITFNEAMTAISTLDQIEAKDIDITIEPQLEGRWIWLGTRTLKFEHTDPNLDRLPGSNDYTVTVPAGLESAAGNTLEKSHEFTFSTPTLQIVDSHIETPSVLTPLWFIEFNQLIDPETIAEHAQLSANGKTLPLRLATPTEIRDVENIERHTENANPDRWVVLRPENPLSADTDFKVTLPPGLNSLEGPNTTKTSIELSGRTFSPLKVTSQNCDDTPCQPGQDLTLSFNNELNLRNFDSSHISIEPELESMSIHSYFDSITVTGLTNGQTEYVLTLSPEITDTFGQTLGEETQIKFTIGDARPAMMVPGGLITVDPMVDDGKIMARSINNEALDITVYKVDPTRDLITFDERSWEIARGDYDPEWPIITEGRIDIADAAALTASSGSDDLSSSNEFLEVPIDLGDELEAYGHVAVLVQVRDRDPDDWMNQPQLLWVQRSQYSVDVFSDNGPKAHIWVTDLNSGEPIENAEIELLPGGTGITAENGHTEVTLGTPTRIVLATVDNEVTASRPVWFHSGSKPSGNHMWYVINDRGLYKPGEKVQIKGWLRETGSKPADLSITSADRIEYVARDAFGNDIAQGQAIFTALGGFNFDFVIPENTTLGYTSIDLTAIKGDKNVGYETHSFQVQEYRRPNFEAVTDIIQDGPYQLGTRIQLATEANYYAGGPIAQADTNWTIAADPGSYSPPNWAEYTFGIFTPWWLNTGPQGPRGGHGRPDSFGLDSISSRHSGLGPANRPVEYRTKTDMAGRSVISVGVETEGLIRPVSVTAHSTVTDVDSQPITSSTNVLLHPASHYVGLKTERVFIQAGETLDVDWIVTDIDGVKGADAHITIKAEGLKTVFERGIWTEETTEVATCDITATPSNSEGSCALTLENGGRYRISAILTDSDGNQNLTEITRWVAGAEPTFPTRQITHDNLTVIPDKRNYQPGERAEILIQAPFNEAHGLAFVTRFGIDSVIPIEFDTEGSSVLKLDITEDDIPGFGLRIEAAGVTKRSDADIMRPAYATGALSIEVPADSRRLDISVSPRLGVLSPGASTSIDVTVTDAKSEPVEDAELLVFVVDEAVLALTDYQVSDPLEAFYRQTQAYIESQYGRSTVLLSDLSAELPADGAGYGGGDMAVEASAEMAMDAAAATPDMTSRSAPQAGMALTKEESAAGGAADAAGGEQGSPISLRTNFDAVAVYDPKVTTDEFGKAVIDLDLPDNLTRYRAVVVATGPNGTDAGNSDANITARLPIMLRPAPPRFANFGDRFDFGVVIQNTTSTDMEVDVALRTSNLKLIDGTKTTAPTTNAGGAGGGAGGGAAGAAGGEAEVWASSQTVTVPANDRIHVEFAAETESAGIAQYQAVVVTSDDKHSDAASGHFPIYTPATSEAFATYGVVEGDVLRHPIQTPTDVFKEFGGLELTTSSTAVATLADAVIYLDEYRYLDADALASRILGFASLGDIWDAFATSDMPDSDGRDQIIQRDLADLARLQTSDGGFRFWISSRESNPYITVHVAHALVKAKNAGFDINEAMLETALWYLAGIETHYPDSYSDSIKETISAYALSVRFDAGDRDINKAKALYKRASKNGEPNIETAAWLWPILATSPEGDLIETLIGNRVSETAAGVTFTTGYTDGAHLLLHSNRRSDAVVLDALLKVKPESDLVLKTVNELLSARTAQGWWATPQENAFILSAGARYFAEFENEDPDFVSRMWLDKSYVAEHVYKNRTTRRDNTTIPMDYLMNALGWGKQDLTVQRDGDAGRLYYRLGVKYAPKDLKVATRDQGFVISRTYSAIDNEDDVTRNEDGTWTIRQGAKVRVNVTMVADSARSHVALVDPLPAGLEPVNPLLATSEPDYGDSVAEGDENAKPASWWYYWFEHQNLRDDRAEAFATWLPAGSYDYSYVARAVTTGDFVVPAAKAEELYEPETFGRSATTFVTIEAQD